MIRTSSRLVLGVVGAVLILVLIGAAVIGSTRETVDVDPGTPQATVQSYLQAVADDRRSDALGFLTDDLRARCLAGPAGGTYPGRVSRVVLTKTDLDGETARVRVDITETFGGGLFGADESTFDMTFALTRSPDGWRITDNPWPFGCIPKVAP